MQFSIGLRSLRSLACAVAALTLFSSLHAATQSIPLNAGWNAVFPTVQPDNPDPNALFADLPIEQCALWLPGKATVTSLTDPNAMPTKATEWSTWLPPTHPAAFLTNLHRIPARRPLLIKATAPCTLTLTGQPTFAPIQWKGGAFNLTGFDVDPSNPPTFAFLFADAAAIDPARVFKLSQNRWQPVAPAEFIAPNTAYWVWCDHGTSFQGPLALAAPLQPDGTLALATDGSRSTLHLTVGSLPANLRIEAAGSLQLSAAIADAAPASLSTHTTTIEPGQTLNIALQPAVLAPSANTSTLTLSGAGMRFTLPVSAN